MICRLTPIVDTSVKVLSNVLEERMRQEMLRLEGKFKTTCSDRNMDEFHKLAILAEEFGEVSRLLAEQAIDSTRRNPVELRKELIQVAAVAVAWCEAIDNS